MKFYEAHETLQLFEGVKAWLLKNCKKVCNYRQKSLFVLGLMAVI